MADAGEVALPVLIGHYGERLRSHHFDARRPPNAATRAVGCDDVCRAPRGLFARNHGPALDHDAVAVAVLLDGDDFRAETYAHVAGVLQLLVNFLFDRVLSDNALPRRRLIEIGLGTRTAIFCSRHAGGDRETVRIARQAAVADSVLDAPLAEQRHPARHAAAR